MSGAAPNHVLVERHHARAAKRAAKAAQFTRLRQLRDASCVVAEFGPPPVLGPAGVAIVDAILEYEDSHDCGPTWFALASSIGASHTNIRKRCEQLRAVGVITWTAEKNSIAVVGRYLEAGR